MPAHLVSDVGEGHVSGRGEVVDARSAAAEHSGDERVGDVLGVHQLQWDTEVREHRGRRGQGGDQPAQRLGQGRGGLYVGQVLDQGRRVGTTDDRGRKT